MNAITYSEIYEFLKTTQLDNTPHSILVRDFVSYLHSLLLPFQLLHKYCTKEIDLDEVTNTISTVDPITINENDRRFFQAIYCERLVSHFSSHANQLLLGSTGYFDKKKHATKPHATKWNIVKDLQGASFMETVIYSGEVPGKIIIVDKSHETGKGGVNKDQKYGEKFFYKWWKKACTNLGTVDVGLYGGTRHSSAVALREHFSTEQIKQGTMHQTNKAFERYFRIEAEVVRNIYNHTSTGSKNLAEKPRIDEE